MFKLGVLIVVLLFRPGDFVKKEFIGCYEDNYTIKFKILNEIYGEADCVQNCYREYYPYALFRVRNNCACSHFIGEMKNESRCEDYCPHCDMKNQIRNVFFTGFRVLGPPTNVIISNVTDTQLHLSWNPPDIAKIIFSYSVSAKVLQSYSSVRPRDLSWNFSNDTTYNELSSLHPGTHYNVSIWGTSTLGQGIPAYQIVETKIGQPSHIPESPKILSRTKTTMIIQLKPIINDNGPVSSYLIVVANRSSFLTVDTENLMSKYKALNNSLSYYITAELLPEMINENETFVIGDGKIYGEYSNDPLSPTTSYDVILGVTSKKDDVETRAFSQSVRIFTKVYRPEEGFVSNTLLIALIIVLCLALLLALSIFLIMKRRLANDYRRHSNDTQELRVRGNQPIDVENHGYIAEERTGYVNYYEDLRKQVWMIPHQALKIDYTQVLGRGSFGYVYKASLERDVAPTEVLVYSIADKRLSQDQKDAMLKNLGVLIKVGKHKNLLEFIGTCENLDSICIAMEFMELNLKEYLLASRIQTDKSYTTLNASAALNIALGVTRGLHYLHSKNIIHKQLCTRHVAMINENIPKIYGYGLIAYYKDGTSLNCTRWTAREVLNGDNYSVKSDVWSLACLIWEICALGGTPFVSIGNYEVSEKILRGCTLARLPCMDTELYQTLLNCWQISTDERPFVNSLEETFEFYLSNASNYLDFTLKQDEEFTYEQFDQEQELNYPMA